MYREMDMRFWLEQAEAALRALVSSSRFALMEFSTLQSRPTQISSFLARRRMRSFTQREPS